MPKKPTPSALEELDTLSSDLALLDDKGKAPKHRAMSAAVIRANYNKMIQDDEGSATMRVRVQGSLDGDPPYNPAARRAQKQTSLANANFLQGAKIVQKVANGYNDIIFSVKTLFSVETEFGEDAERFDYSRVLAEEGSRTMRKWPSFAAHFQMLVRKFVDHGVGIGYFPDTEDWRYEVAGFGDFQIPRQTPATEEKIQIAVSKQDMPVTSLFDHIRDEEKAADLGWNVAAVKKALARATDKTSTGELGEYESLQMEIKNNDATFNRKYQYVRLLRAFVREFDGTLSFYILERDGDGECLYYRPSHYKTVNEAFVFFCYGIGNGTYHGVRGLGHTLYPLVQLHNRLMCSMSDSAMLSSGVMVQPNSQKALDELSIQMVGPLVVLSAGTDVVEKAIPNLATSSMPMLNEVKDRMAESGSQFSVRPGGETYRNRLESEASMEEAAGGASANVDLFYASWDRLVREMFKRICNGSKDDPLIAEFHRRVARKGVPPEAIKAIDHDSTYATRAIGAGNPAFRTVGINSLMQLLPNFNELGQKRLINLITADRVGYQNADYFAPEPDGITLNGEAKIAEMENILLFQGNAIGVNPQELHATHALIHAKPLQQTIEGIERGEIDPVQSLPGLRAMLDHLAGHAEPLAQDPAQRAVFGMVKEGINNLTQIVDNFERSIRSQERQGEAAPQGGEQDTDGAAKARVAEIRVAEAEFKFQLAQRIGEIKIAELQAKSQQSLALNDARGAAMAAKALSSPALSYNDRR